jgi:queuine tRNA-ribosyltransferase
MFKFEILHQSKKSRARVGRIHTPHGIIETPNFVPVATNAAIKTVDSTIVKQLNVDLMFCNTYHLLLHPGADTIEQAGGLHKFMGRTQPLITDSGGFQVFSLAYGGVEQEIKSKGQKKYDGSILKINEEGVTFRSYRDGAKIILTPESSVQAQKKIGADIIIPLDELPPYHTDKRYLKRSLDRTHRWEERSLDEHLKNPREQAMYAVVHGGIDPELRKLSCQHLSKLAFDGFGIGGSLGKTRDEMIMMLKQMMPYLPENKPNHLLGIGDLPSIEEAIPLGIDTFDSSYPTKAARHGVLFTFDGPIKIQQTKWRNCFEKISDAPLCKEYTAAYIHHLFKAHESVAHTLASIHNIDFMMKLMARYRQLILDDKI